MIRKIIFEAQTGLLLGIISQIFQLDASQAELVDTLPGTVYDSTKASKVEKKTKRKPNKNLNLSYIRRAKMTPGIMIVCRLSTAL